MPSPPLDPESPSTTVALRLTLADLERIDSEAKRRRLRRGTLLRTLVLSALDAAMEEEAVPT